MTAAVEHQPRERAVACPWHDPRHPVLTWNWSGRCDAHERTEKREKAA